MSRPTSIPSRRGFTIMELSVVLIIIALLAGILIVGVREALRTTRGTAEKQFVSVLKLGVEQFREQFGILPPLVDDRPNVVAPITSPTFGAAVQPLNGEWVVAILGDPNFDPAHDRASMQKFLSRDSSNWYVQQGKPPYSELSLPYYLAGTLTKGLDGVEGMGFTAVERNGYFSKRGKPVDPLFAADREAGRIAQRPSQPTDLIVQYRLFDKFVRPIGQPIRYYRWLPTYYDRTNVAGGAQVGDIKDMNVPFAVGDPMKNTLLRSAAYAVVSAGPNHVFGDEPIGDIRLELGSAVSSLSDAEARDVARSDNIVEVGQ